MKKILITILLIGLMLTIERASAQTAWAEEMVCGQWRLAYCPFNGANTPVFQPCGSSQLWVVDPTGAYSLFREGQFVRLYNPNVSYGDGFVCEGQEAGYLWTARLAEPISSCSICLPVQNNPPSGYSFCANEGERCSFNGIADVAYGANDQFNYRYEVSGGIDCINATFGDPIMGVRKACYIKQAAPAPVPTPIPPTPTPWPTPTPITEPIVWVRNTTVNLRSGPGTNYSVIGKASSGTQLRITGKNPGGDWWQVCCVSSQKAWVAAWVVDALGPLGQIPVVAQPSSGPTSASPTPTSLPPQGEKTPSGGLRAGDLAVTTSSLRLRSDPSIRSRTLTTMVTGTYVRVIEGPKYADGFTWWRVRPTDSGDTSGWCAANWLSRVQLPNLDLEPWCEKGASAQLSSDLTKQACQYFRSEDDFGEFINLVLQSGVSSTQCLINAIEMFELALQTGVWNPPPEMAQNCAEAYVDIVDLIKETEKDW